MKHKHIICYSGGHSSALVAIEVTRVFGKENVILLNHNINPRFEDKDIKRFKKEVADYLGIEITYANYNGITDENLIPSQFDVCLTAGSFVNPNGRQILCTALLKTKPFYNYLKTIEKDNICVYYGFDEVELERVERRRSILISDGVETDYPLALWSFDLVKNFNDFKIENLLKNFNKVNETKLKTIPSDYLQEAIKLNLIEITEWNGSERTIFSTKEIGIEPPNTYNIYKHANCKGCLKAGKQHWYVVYCTDYEIYQMGKDAENKMGHSFGKEFLKDLEPVFKKMKEIGIPANEHIPSGKFWKSAKKYLTCDILDMFPCECFS